jgi:hypothetical protein
MNALKKLMAVLRIVPTPMDHTLAAVILATALAVMDTPAMVLIIIITAHLTYWTLITDIDECQEETHQCALTCNNTIGSYVCQCNAGYSLGIDEIACFGKT